MPKLFGLSLAGVIVASIAYFAIGAAWYGFIFPDTWMAEMGMTKADDESTPATYLIGFAMTVLEVIGIGLVMKWRNAMNLNGGVVTAAILWLCFAVPFCAYGYLYSATHSTTLLMIDAGHLLVGWVASAVVLALVKA